MKRRLLGTLFSLTLMLAMLPALGLSKTVYADDGIRYLDDKGKEQTYTGAYTPVENSASDVTWNEGWYVVDGDVSISGSVAASGDVNLILCDGAKLTINASGKNAVSFPGAGNFYIYAQSTGENMGALSVTATDNKHGIFSNNHSVTINGGNITAVGKGEDASGIYAYDGITVNGGNVTARGNSGIYAYSDIAINGGTVSFAEAAADKKNSIDICSEKGSITIAGGAVNVTGQRGIYTKNSFEEQNVGIAINNGSVSATGNTGYGIYANHGNVMINSGNVDAKCDGGGIYAPNGDITIAESIVTATGNAYPGGIVACNLSITNSIVTSTSNEYIGIVASSLTVDGGEVTAGTNTSLHKAIDVSGNVSVSDGSVKATGGQYGIKTGGNIGIIDGEVIAEGDNYGILSSGEIAVSNSTVEAEATGDGIFQHNYGISSKTITITDSKVKADGIGDYSCGIYSDEGVIINSGDVTANGELAGINADDGDVTINGGNINVRGTSDRPSYGITANNVIIQGGNVTAASTYKAVYGTVKNAIAGTGWLNAEGTGEAKPIEVNTEGQDLSIYKKVQFPRPAASVKNAPTARSLTANGNAQELVTAGAASGGTMQYALGSAAGASGSYSPSIPTGTDAGDYYVWYKAVGDSAHTDSDAACVIVTIAEKGSDPAPAKTVKSVTVNSATVSAKTLDAAVKKAGGSKNTVTTITLGKKVKKISKGAFKNYKKAKTLVVKTKKLKKATVKNSLKGSKITKVKVKIGKKKTNKSYVKKYKKIFTKKNAGKKVKVSL